MFTIEKLEMNRTITTFSLDEKKIWINFFFFSSISFKIDHNDSNDDNFSLYIEIEFNSTDIPFSYRANDTSNIIHSIIDFFLSFFQSVVAIAIFIEVNITPLENEERRTFYQQFLSLKFTIVFRSWK